MERLQATHFIEVYKGVVTGIINHTHPLPIQDLNDVLKITIEKECLQTIAVWKIKLKEKV